MMRGELLRLTEKQLRNFWKKVDKPTPSGCWLWTAGRDRDGYGSFTVRNHQPSDRGAHRVSWELVNGPIPPGMCVCHKCDTPACVRPEHLFLGTHADNVADKVAKGRGRVPRGEKNGGAKLTERDVIEIRRLRHEDRVMQKDLAVKYGISRTAISKIITRDKWKHVPG